MQQQRKAAAKKKKAKQQQPQNHAPPTSAQTAPPAIPPILRWMAGMVETSKMSPMMLFAGLMQMVHMERQLETADDDTKLAFGELIKGTVNNDVVRVFVRQCFENAHPAEAAAETAAAETVPETATETAEAAATVPETPAPETPATVDTVGA
jgi:hypothetical protein